MADVYDPENGVPPSDELRAHAEKMQQRADQSGVTPPSPEVLEHAEKMAAESPDGNTEHPQQVGRGYVESDLNQLAKIKPSAGGVISFAKKNRGKLTIGGATAGLITLLVIGFFALLPFKILHIVNNLQARYFGVAENAVEHETDQLFSNYVKKYVIPGLNACKGSTINKQCTPRSNMSNSLVGNLYRGWANARLENRLAEKYGIEFKFDSAKQRYFLKTSGMDGDGVDLKDFIGSNDSLDEFIDNSPEFNKYNSRREFRQAVKLALKDSMQDETRWKRVMYRYKVLKLLEVKYGIKFCQIGCPKVVENNLDRFADWKGNKKRAMKMLLVQRVITPRIEMYGLLYECLLNEDCTSKTFSSQSPEPYEADATGCKKGCNTNGAPMTDSDRQIRDNILAKRLLSVYNGDVDALTREYDALQNKGLLGLMQERAKNRAGGDDMKARGLKKLGKLTETQAFKKGITFIPVVGEVNAAFVVVNGIETMKVAIPRMVYVMNSTSAAQFYAGYRTLADECKEGTCDAELLGSFTEALSPGLQIDASMNNQIGGLAGAEQTPLYADLFGNDANKPPTVASIFSPTAYAADDRYLCSNGAPPRGRLVCPEEKIRQSGNTFKKGIDKITANPFWAVLARAAGVWQDAKHGILSWITKGLDAFASAVCSVPLVNKLCEGAEDAANQIISSVGPFVGKQLQEALEFVFTAIFGFNINQISNTMSGGRAFDMLAAGADVSGNEFAHYGLGGEVLSPKQVADIRHKQQEQEEYRFNSQPLFAKAFDKENSKSLISKVALAMPNSPGDIITKGLFGLLKNPYATMTQVVSSVFGAGHAAAAAPFCSQTGNTRYTLSDDESGLFYWEADPPVDQHGGELTVTRSDGTYGIVYRERPGNEGQTQGSAESFAAPDYCDPSEGSGSGVDPFGITQYGYPLDDPVFNEDPEEYWQNNCVGPGSKTIAWNQDGAANASPESSYEPVNKSTNGCLLIQSAVGSAGAIYDDKVLSPEELEGNEGSAAPAPTSSDIQQLAGQILANSNISYPLDSSPNGKTRDILEKLARGEKAEVTCPTSSQSGNPVDINIGILQFVLELGSQTKVGVNALTDKCHSTNSPHYRGISVDFECRAVSFDINRADPIAEKYGIHRNAETCAADEHWHYDVYR